MNKLKPQKVWVETETPSEFRVLRKGIFYEPLIANVEKQSLYCFTKEEMGNIVCEIFTEGHKKGWLRGADGHSGYTKDDAQKFINNLFNDK